MKEGRTHLLKLLVVIACGLLFLAIGMTGATAHHDQGGDSGEEESGSD